MTTQETCLVEDAVFDLRHGQPDGALAVLTALLDEARRTRQGNTPVTDTRERHP